MTNPNAEKINESLGVELFDVNASPYLKLLQFTPKDIKRLMIDDLVDNNNQQTLRLRKFVQEILYNK